jgi:hypothetical protein
MLMLGGPRHRLVAKKNTVAGSGLMGVGTTSPVSVRIDNQISGSSPVKTKAKVKHALNIA